jgi:rubrerythrin
MRHEQAAARFYRELAETSAMPAIRSALSELARAENAHADHLRIFLGTGRFDEPSV